MARSRPYTSKLCACFLVTVLVVVLTWYERGGGAALELGAARGPWISSTATRPASSLEATAQLAAVAATADRAWSGLVEEDASLGGAEEDESGGDDAATTATATATAREV
jgi:hypothetical protein